MTERLIIRERIPSTDPRLKRHVNHDSKSWDYRLDTRGLTVASVRWTRRIPVLDQGSLGSCVGNAAIGHLGTDPIYATLSTASAIRKAMLRDPVRLVPYELNEAGAVRLYSDTTAVDPYAGQYPPDDTGTDGLTVAQVLTAAGEISGYVHTFTLDDMLKALTIAPVITGINWYNSMFNPSAEGIVTVDPASGLAGGHELVADEYDATRGLVGLTNSWNVTWGLQGRLFIPAERYGWLLDQQGDVTQFVPASVPPPVPAPPTPTPPTPGDYADDALIVAAAPWVRKWHIGSNARMARALKTWLDAEVVEP